MGWESRDRSFSSGSVMNSFSSERRNDLLWITGQCRALSPSDILEYVHIENSTTVCHGWTFHTPRESWKMCIWLCCTFRYFNLCQHSSFLQKTHFILENLLVVIVFMNDSMPIISFLACLMVSQMLHIHCVKPLTMVDRDCQKSPTLIFLLCLSFVLFLWL